MSPFFHINLQLGKDGAGIYYANNYVLLTCMGFNFGASHTKKF